VNEEDGQLQDHTGRVGDASNLHLLVCFPDKRNGWRVQPENLIKDHGQLHMYQQ